MCSHVGTSAPSRVEKHLADLSTKVPTKVPPFVEESDNGFRAFNEVCVDTLGPTCPDMAAPTRSGGEWRVVKTSISQVKDY